MQIKKSYLNKLIKETVNEVLNEETYQAGDEFIKAYKKGKIKAGDKVIDKHGKEIPTSNSLTINNGYCINRGKYLEIHRMDYTGEKKVDIWKDDLKIINKLFK